MKQLAKCLTAIICIVNISLLQLYADNENGEQSFFFNFNTEDSNTSTEENSETVPEETTDKKTENPLKTFSPQELSEAATQLESLSNQIKYVIAKANSIPDIENMVKRRIEKKKISLGTIVSWKIYCVKHNFCKRSSISSMPLIHSPKITVILIIY